MGRCINDSQPHAVSRQPPAGPGDPSAVGHGDTQGGTPPCAGSVHPERVEENFYGAAVVHESLEKGWCPGED